MRNIITKKDEPWRDLVNDGHVWQARLNDSNRTSLILALIAISLIAAFLFRPVGLMSGFDKFVAAPIHFFNGYSEEESNYRILGEGSYSINPDVPYKKAANAKQLKKFVSAQLKSLNKNDKLIAQFDYGVLTGGQVFNDPDKFYVKKASDGSFFIGGILKQESYRSYNLYPWVAVFHKTESGKWETRELFNSVGASADGEFSQLWIAPLVDETFFKDERNSNTNTSKGEE